MAFNTKSTGNKDQEILVHCGYDEHTIINDSDKTILQNLWSKKVDILASCGGNGTCGTCKIQVNRGLANLSSKEELEAEFASDRHFNHDERLACQTHAFGPIEITILYKKD